MENLIISLFKESWIALIVIFILYLLKEYLNILFNYSFKKKQLINETNFKYQDKILNQAIPIYMKHYEKLNSGTGTYIFIFDNYEKLDEQYNEVINGDRDIDIFTFKSNYQKYQYRVKNNFDYYLSQLENELLLASNIIKEQGLYIDDNILDSFKTIDTKIEIILENLVEVQKILEESYYKYNDEIYFNILKEELKQMDNGVFPEKVNEYLIEFKRVFNSKFEVKI
ncbi:hypothetical protein NGH50_13115 [Staphylococcus equorum]|uniref:hypothetical protein n=1 Tax=Staphylococcus equorum TaxID=246432 RepID=UPI002DBEC326|nr:hypothetical protein [Staphylococcus equorum]MEB8174852.1 hypothetical protein [Staphylococcus equorum]